AAAAVVAVVGIGAVVVPSRDSADPEPPVATRSADERWPPVVDVPLSDNAPVAYDFATGETTFQEGWTEADRVEEPSGLSETLAVAATDGKRTIYAYFVDQDVAAFTDASDTPNDFQTWAHGISNSTPGISWEAGSTAEIRKKGRVDGWTLVREISNPFDYDAPWDSVGVVIERDGIEQWVFIREIRRSNGTMGDSGDSGSTYAIPGKTIEDWLADVERSEPAANRPDRTGFETHDTITDVVEFSGSKVVPTRDGVVVLDQIADPDINESFAADTSQTAAARITVDGEEQYVLVQEKESATRTKNVSWAFAYTLFPAPYAEDRGPVSLDEFAAIVRRNHSPRGGPWT
ncbi:hypothetical protein ACFVBP_28335, partial [Nocardioides sp. NPDC057764]